MFKRAVGLLVLVWVVAACTPAAGRPAIPYIATQSEIIATVMAIGNQIQPSEAYNFLSVEGIGESYVTLIADSTVGFGILAALTGASTTQIKITVTTVQSGDITQMAIGGSPGGDATANATIERIITELDRRFRRAPQ